MANETILVTGATGKVGQRLVPRLLSWREPGDEIRVLVRTPEAAGHFAAAGAQTVVGDLTEAGDRKRALDGAALVVNVAATFRSPAVTEADMLAGARRSRMTSCARPGRAARARTR